MEKKRKIVVVALGGNATSENRVDAESIQVIVDLIDNGCEVVLTHGNGPQVGQLMESDPETELWEHVVKTQYQIGSELGKALFDRLLSDTNFDHGVKVIPGELLYVNPKDPAFTNPTKFVGPGYNNKDDVKKIAEKLGYQYAMYGGTGKYRLVVPSPKPLQVVGSEDVTKRIYHYLDNGVIPIVFGGGGIATTAKPDDEDWTNLNVVLDKDATASLLARTIGAEALIILMKAPCVFMPNSSESKIQPEDFNLGDSKLIPVTQINVDGVEAMIPLLENGSVRPKVQAGIDAAKEGIPTIITDAHEFYGRYMNQFSGDNHYGTVIHNGSFRLP